MDNEIQDVICDIIRKNIAQITPAIMLSFALEVRELVYQALKEQDAIDFNKVDFDKVNKYIKVQLKSR